MTKRWAFPASMTVLAAIAVGVACADDTMTGPMFGDLSFTPSIDNVGADRMTTLTLANESEGSLGPILIGLDAVFQTVFPDSLCSSIVVSVSPSSVTALAPNAETAVDVTIDTQDVDNVDCPPDQYDADLFAAVNGRVLGGATVRFDWDGTPP